MRFRIKLNNTGEKIFDKMQQPSTQCVFAHDPKIEKVMPFYGFDVFKAAVTHNRFQEFYPGSFVIVTCDWENTDREELALLTKLAKG